MASNDFSNIINDPPEHNFYVQTIYFTVYMDAICHSFMTVCWYDRLTVQNIILRKEFIFCCCLKVDDGAKSTLN